MFRLAFERLGRTALRSVMPAFKGTQTRAVADVKATIPTIQSFGGAVVTEPTDNQSNARFAL